MAHWKKFRFLRSILILALIFSSSIFTRPSSGQEDLSSFQNTFTIFQKSSDIYKLYDLTPPDIVFGLPLSYKIGPGDIIQVVITGMINDSMLAQVGPQGDIYIPQAGLMKVEGRTIGETRNLIDVKLSKNIINYNCAVQLVKARKIKIYFLGQVRQPGVYMVIGGTTVTSLIQTAGAVVVNPLVPGFNESAIAHPYIKALTSGAGRRIEIWRDGEKFADEDISEIAIKGKVNGDVVLEDGDAVFVPPNKSPVIVRGGIARPGTYEVDSGDTVYDLLAQAGGFASMILTDAVCVERKTPGGTQADNILIDLNLSDPLFDPKSFIFQPGDILRVPEPRNKVFVMGAVFSPQTVDFHEGWNVMDYVSACGGPIETSDISDIHIVKFPLTTDQTEVVFSLKNLYLGRSVEFAPIEPGDFIWVGWKNKPFAGTGIVNVLSNFISQTIGIISLARNQ